MKVLAIKLIVPGSVSFIVGIGAFASGNFLIGGRLLLAGVLAIATGCYILKRADAAESGNGDDNAAIGSGHRADRTAEFP